MRAMTAILLGLGTVTSVTTQPGGERADAACLAAYAALRDLPAPLAPPAPDPGDESRATRAGRMGSGEWGVGSGDTALAAAPRCAGGRCVLPSFQRPKPAPQARPHPERADSPRGQAGCQTGRCRFRPLAGLRLRRALGRR